VHSLVTSGGADPDGRTMKRWLAEASRFGTASEGKSEALPSGNGMSFPWARPQAKSLGSWRMHVSGRRARAQGSYLMFAG
jgi:hypothetical protein